MIERLPFTYLHIFPYSERPGTPAADASDHLPVPVRKERGRVLKAIAQRKNLAFRRTMLGRTFAAVTLGNGRALTSNYIEVELASPQPPCRLIDVTVGNVTDDGVRELSAFPVLA